MKPRRKIPGPRFSPQDHEFMDVALRLARRALGMTYPNPAVGAVIARGGKILGKGFHRRAGGPHAEIEALNDCRRRGHSPRGATLYVTLEPCNHHGRTPPCTDAIIAAGIRRVVAAARDPNRAIPGKGLERLAAAGIRVESGLLEDRTRELNEAFFRFHEDHRPWITLKWAMTLDGCTSAASGDSFWITGEEARRDAHRLRALHACVAVGIGTILRDNPRLTVRDVPWNGPQPLRLVVDTRLRIPERARILEGGPGQVLIATCAAPGSRKARRLETRGARILPVKPKRGTPGVSISKLLEALRELGVQSVLVEGGRRLAGSFFAVGAVDRVVGYISASLLGSAPTALGPLLGGPRKHASDRVRLQEVRLRRLGADFRIEGRPLW